MRLSLRGLSKALAQDQEDEVYTLDVFKEDDDPDDGLDTMILYRAGRLRGPAAREARRRLAEHNARWKAMNPDASDVDNGG